MKPPVFVFCFLIFSVPLAPSSFLPKRGDSCCIFPWVKEFWRRKLYKPIPCNPEAFEATNLLQVGQDALNSDQMEIIFHQPQISLKF